MSNEEIQNIDSPELEANEIENHAKFDSVSYDDLEEGIVKIDELPTNVRHNLVKEAREKITDKDEALAWEMGWRPKNLFLGKNRDGSQKEWVDHKTFLEKIEKSPFANVERVKTLATKTEEKNKEIESLREQIKNLTKLQKIQVSKSLDQNEKQLRDEINQAKEELDFDRFSSANDALRKLNAEKEELDKFNPEPEIIHEQPQKQFYEIEFETRNKSWYGSDPKMTAYASYVDQNVRLFGQPKDISEHLAIVEREVKSTFANHFQEENYDRYIPNVESAKNATAFAPKPKEKSFEDLNKKDQELGHDLIREGQFKSKMELMTFLNKK